MPAAFHPHSPFDETPVDPVAAAAVRRVLSTPELAACLDVLTEVDPLDVAWLAEADVAEIVAYCEAWRAGEVFPAEEA